MLHGNFIFFTGTNWLCFILYTFYVRSRFFNDELKISLTDNAKFIHDIILVFYVGGLFTAR